MAMPPVDVQGGPGHIGRSRRCQIRNGLSDILGLAETAQGNTG